MHINFESLKINNFLSFKSAELQLNNNGYVVVSGINKFADDRAKSNGSGKSSIWDAITWCLTGETIRGVKDVVNNLFRDVGCFVELHFEVDGSQYKVIRSKDHKELKTNLKIFINGVDKSGKGIRDSEKLLAEYLPDLTSSFIGSVIILGQGLPDRFTNNTPAGRKEILEKLSKSDFMIADIKSSLQKRENALQQDLRNVQDKLLTCKSKLQIISSQRSANTERLNTFGTSEDLIAKLRDLQTQQEKVKEELKLENSNKFNLTQRLQTLQLNASSFAKEFQDSTNAIENEYSDKLQEKSSNITELQSKLYAIQHEIKTLKSITDTCPTCGQKLPGVEKPSTKQQEQQAIQLSILLENERTQYNDIKSSCETAKQQVTNNYDNKQTQMKEQAARLSTDVRNQEKVCVQLQALYNDLIDSIRKTEAQIQNFNTLRNQLEDLIKEENDVIDKLNAEILYYNKEEESISKHLEIINKMTTIISRDFRGYLLSNVISFLNKKAKEYCLDIFETDKISISLEGNNIEIGYNNKSYAGLSGGERQKVDIIVQLSIRDMLSKFLGYTCNILVLDEIFDNLDSVGCDQLLNLFARKLSDVSSIYIISHHADSLNIPYDKEIVVVKNEIGFSEIE